MKRLEAFPGDRYLLPFIPLAMHNQREIEKACRRAGQALTYIEQRKTIKLLQRIGNFRSELDSWASTSYVTNLDRQITTTRINLIGR